MVFPFERFIPKIKSEVLNLFPSTVAIIIWGGSLRSDFSPKSGDIDLIIVANENLNNVQTIQEELNTLVNNFKKDVELDPSITDRENLSKLYLITSYNTRRAHGIDQFLIKHKSRVIYGDDKIMDLISDISIDDALRDVAPHVRDEFITKISKGIDKSQDIKSYVLQEKSKFIVIIRTLFTLETRGTGSKTEVLDYLATKHPNVSELSKYLKELYVLGRSDEKITKKEVVDLLELVKKEIEEFLGK